MAFRMAGQPYRNEFPTSDPTQAAKRARTQYNAIQSQAPASFGSFIEPALQKSLAFQMDQGGMPQEEFDQARQDLGSQLDTAIARASAGSAARGSYNPGNVARSTRPTIAAYGRSLSDLYAKRAKMRQDAMTEALRAGISLAPIAADQSRAAQEGYGNLYAKESSGGGANWWLKGFNP